MRLLTSEAPRSLGAPVLVFSYKKVTSTCARWTRLIISCHRYQSIRSHRLFLAQRNAKSKTDHQHEALLCRRPCQLCRRPCQLCQRPRQPLLTATFRLVSPEVFQHRAKRMHAEERGKNTHMPFNMKSAMKMTRRSPNVPGIGSRI